MVNLTNDASVDNIFRQSKDTAGARPQVKAGPACLTHVAQMSAYVVRFKLDLWSTFSYYLNDPHYGDQKLQHDDRIVCGGASKTWFANVAGIPMKMSSARKLGSMTSAMSAFFFPALNKINSILL